MNQPIVDISAGYQHCTCTSFGGRTFAWGRNNYGQLGLGKEAFDAGWIGKPTEIKWRPGSEKVRKKTRSEATRCAAPAPHMRRSSSSL